MAVNPKAPERAQPPVLDPSRCVRLPKGLAWRWAVVVLFRVLAIELIRDQLNILTGFRPQVFECLQVVEGGGDLPEMVRRGRVLRNTQFRQSNLPS